MKERRAWGVSVATSGVVRSVPIELSEERPASSLWVVGCGDGFAQVGVLQARERYT